MASHRYWRYLVVWRLFSFSFDKIFSEITKQNPSKLAGGSTTILEVKDGSLSEKKEAFKQEAFSKDML